MPTPWKKTSGRLNGSKYDLGAVPFCHASSLAFRFALYATREFAHGKHARNDAFGHPSYSNYGFSLIPLCNHRCRDRCM